MNKIDKNTIPEDFSVGLAIFDFLPVLFFILSAVVLSNFLNSPVFLIGVILTFISGILKVIWKIIVATKKKNIWPLFIQMRILMPIGFLIILLGIFLNRASISIDGIIKAISIMPAKVFFILWFVGMAIMTVCCFVLDSSNLKHNIFEQSINSIAQLCLLIGLIFTYLNSGSYEPNAYALAAMQDAQFFYHVEKTDDKICFIPETDLVEGKPKSAFIFYPGGKVNYESYAPLMSMLAANNVLCIIVKMPYDLAIFSPNAADGIIEQYPDIKHWYIGGHSLGGVMAASYVSNNADQFDGLFLLASYSTKDLTNKKVPVLSIYGSNDQVLNKENYEKNKSNLPSDTTEFILEGGCHAYFGSYGPQEGDGEPTITDLDQASYTASKILEFIYQTSK